MTAMAPDMTKDKIVLVMGGASPRFYDSMELPVCATSAYEALFPTEMDKEKRKESLLQEGARPLRIFHETVVGTTDEIVAYYSDRIRDIWRMQFDPQAGETYHAQYQETLQRNGYTKPGIQVIFPPSRRELQTCDQEGRLSFYDQTILGQLVAEYRNRRFPGALPATTGLGRDPEDVQKLIDALQTYKEDCLKK